MNPKVYVQWRVWVSSERGGYQKRVLCSRTTKAVCHQSATALTKASLFAAQQKLLYRLRRHHLAELDRWGQCEVTQPSHFFQCDEKGVNDEGCSGLRLLGTAGCSARSRTGLAFRHASLLTFANACGQVAPPCVMLAGKAYHPDFEKLWPAPCIRVQPKGSFTAASFAEAIGAVFVPFIRRQLGLTGPCLGT